MDEKRTKRIPFNELYSYLDRPVWVNISDESDLYEWKILKSYSVSSILVILYFTDGTSLNSGTILPIFNDVF